MHSQSNDRMKRPSHSRESETLIGWKAIAEHLNCCQTTAKTWHARAGLPIRKVAGTRIESTTADLDEWRGKQREWLEFTGKQNSIELDGFGVVNQIHVLLFAQYGLHSLLGYFLYIYAKIA